MPQGDGISSPRLLITKPDDPTRCFWRAPILAFIRGIPLKVEQREALIGIRAFVDVALQGLSHLYNSSERTFFEKLIRHGTDMNVTGRARAESLQVLLGLYEAYHYDIEVPFDLPVLTEYQVSDASSVASLAQLGLSLWMTARSQPELLESLYQRVALSHALDMFEDAAMGNTRALSWFLTGLSEIRLSDGEEPEQLEELAFMTRQKLFLNYGGFGVFCHTHKRRLFTRITSKFGNFEDQVFGIYAFARFGRAFGDEQALNIARDCAECLINNQGELGQWWHSYEQASGTVVRKFPVRSVCQFGLAPLALYEVGELTGLPVLDAIEYGLAWVRGDNELNFDLLDRERSLIWEGAFDTKYNTYAKEWSVSRGLKSQKDKKKPLAVSWECRAGDLGWLLYALAGHLS